MNPLDQTEAVIDLKSLKEVCKVHFQIMKTYQLMIPGKQTS